MRAVTPFLFTLIFGAVRVLAQEAPGTFVYHGEACTEWLGTRTEIFTDSSARMDVHDVLQLGRFEKVQREIPNLGVTPSVNWLRFQLTNLGNSDVPMILVHYPEIEELDLYMQEGRSVQRLAFVGQRRPVDRAVQSTPLYGFRIPLPVGRSATILLRVHSLKQVQLPIAICDQGFFQHYATTRNFWIGGFIGIMLVMALYNLFVFFSIRDKSYLIYVVYIALVCGTQLSFLGSLGFHVLPYSTWFATNSSLVLTCFTAIAAGAFMDNFLSVRRQIASYRYVTIGFSALLLACVGAIVANAPLLGYQVAQAAAGTYAFYQLYIAVLLRRRGSRSAIYFLLAWSLFLAGVMLFVLKDKDVLPFNAFTNYTMPVGSVAEVVLLSFGLGDRINILRREKERSQAESLRISLENERIIREQNMFLEQKVTERTRELRESNEHLKRTQAQLVNAEKMAGLGQLTAGIAHEINNPVNFISSNIPPLRRNIGELMDVLKRYRELGATLDTPEVRDIRQEEEQLGIEDSIAETGDILNSIENGASRTAEIVRGLRNFSRLDEGDLKAADINEGLRSTLAVLAPQIRDKVNIELDLGALPAVECYPGKLNQVFMNILTNAAQAVKTAHPDGGGTVTVSTRTENDRIVIRIMDNGPGFSEAVKARMFEPFFTTKGVGEGTGLGLSIAYGIMEKHNGSIEAFSRPGEGAEFRMVLPLEPTQAAKRA